jgi:hypothetical protein
MIKRIIFFIVGVYVAYLAIADWRANAEISRMWIHGSTIDEVFELGHMPTMRAKYFYACHLYTHCLKNPNIAPESKVKLWGVAMDIFGNIAKIAPKYEKAAENLQIMEAAINAQR